MELVVQLAVIAIFGATALAVFTRAPDARLSRATRAARRSGTHRFR